MLGVAGPATLPGKRGQVLQVTSVPNRTSGRRLASWGSVHATGKAGLRQWRPRWPGLACVPAWGAHLCGSTVWVIWLACPRSVGCARAGLQQCA